ncbi:hypothetical protein [Nocardioides sp. YIM 152588]|uniref:hypothetical protein n=1 Tax=Nocardioides sp. YIM 152588 TaxID=3158259 RepID=UPI0032E4D628
MPDLRAPSRARAALVVLRVPSLLRRAAILAIVGLLAATAHLAPSLRGDAADPGPLASASGASCSGADEPARVVAARRRVQDARASLRVTNRAVAARVRGVRSFSRSEVTRNKRLLRQLLADLKSTREAESQAALTQRVRAVRADLAAARRGVKAPRRRVVADLRFARWAARADLASAQATLDRVLGTVADPCSDSGTDSGTDPADETGDSGDTGDSTGGTGDAGGDGGSGGEVGAGAETKVLGMSAPASLWDQRLGEVGSCGVGARRIFASLQADGRARASEIEATLAAGMMPVVSYKVPSVDTLIAGGYDAWLDATGAYLAGLGEQVTATFWHEPHGDMPVADFRAGSRRFLDRVQSATTAVGPILNGWLLDRRVDDFAAYTSPGLLRDWDFVGVDSYHSGTASAPGPLLPARAVPLLAEWLDEQGFPDKPIGLGEYNGYSADALTEAGEMLLSTPELWFGLVWNSTGDKYVPLTGDRLTAFRETKDDPRVARTAAC